MNELLASEMGLSGKQPAPSSPNATRRSLGDLPLLEVPLAAILAIISLPLIAIIALAVLLTMGPPVLYVQMRVGRDGKVFPLVKFRSMITMNDSDGSPLPDKVRVTPVGRFLRRTRLDELPEFWNVLCRHMSLIGPRPLLPETIASMGEGGRIRCGIRPGLTGWAQVNGNALLNDADKLSLDRWYVTNRSLAIDALIAAKTLLVVLRGESLNHHQIKRAYASATDRGSGGHTGSLACDEQNTRLGP